jgi:hypothetical protein
MNKRSRYPGNLPLSRKPKVHPQWHVDQNNLRRSCEAAWDGCLAAKAVHHPMIAIDYLRVLPLVSGDWGELPPLLPKQAINLDVAQTLALSDNSRQGRLPTPGVSYDDCA